MKNLMLSSTSSATMMTNYSMDRIELDEELELEQYKNKQLKPLDLPQNELLSRFKVKKVSNTDHAKKVALADEIKQLWGVSIPRIMKIISAKGYQFTLETFNEVRKSNAHTPVALFLWKCKQCKVELKEV